MTSKASTAGKAATRAGKAASAALKHGALKGGAMLGAKGLVAGGALGAFAVRRIAPPFLWAGGAVCAAGWFGAFEAALSVTKIACPVPAKPDERAQMLGVATVPVTGGAILWARLAARTGVRQPGGGGIDGLREEPAAAARGDGGRGVGHRLGRVLQGGPAPEWRVEIEVS